MIQGKQLGTISFDLLNQNSSPKVGKLVVIVSYDAVCLLSDLLVHYLQQSVCHCVVFAVCLRSSRAEKYIVFLQVVVSTLDQFITFKGSHLSVKQQVELS